MLKQALCLTGEQLGARAPVKTVRGLVWAELCACPFPPQKHEGARLAGLRFERAVWSRTGGLHNPWIAYEDATGEHVACPDIVLPEQKIVIECKLTYTPIADMQLAQLYLPLVKHIWGDAPWKLIVACKRWAGAPKKLITSPAFAAGSEVNYWLI
jgi:hypothetical protein